MAKFINADRLLQRLTTINSTVEQGIKYYNSVYNLVNEQPAADVVEVKRGEWMLHPDGSGTCSCCNRTQKSVWDYDSAQNFCGHCGADMRGENNG